MRRPHLRIAAAAALLLPAGGAWHPAGAQLALSAAGFAASVEHRVSAGRGLETASGTAIGIGATLALGAVELDGTAAGGNLSAVTATADNQGFSTLALRAALLPMPWLALSAGVSLAAYDTPLARQRWTTSRVGAEVRLPFTTGGLSAMARLELFPTVAVTGLDRPDLGLAAGTGLGWHAGPFTASLVYALERYDFPLNAGTRRHEQVATLTARVGLRLAARHLATGQ